MKTLAKYHVYNRCVIGENTIKNILIGIYYYVFSEETVIEIPSSPEKDDARGDTIKVLSSFHHRSKQSFGRYRTNK